MDTSEQNHTRTANASHGTASAPLSNGGSKGRSGGSKFKNLLAKLSGGHGSKGSKPAAASGAASLSAAGGQADASNSARAKANSNTRSDDVSRQTAILALSKSVSKQANSHNTSKMPVTKQDTIGAGVASRDLLQDPIHPGSSMHPAKEVGHIHPAARLSPVSTDSSDPVDYFGLKGVLPVRTTDGQQYKPSEDSSSDLDALRYRAENSEYDNDEIDGADADASIRPITPSSIDASSSFTGSTSLHSLAPTSRTFKSFRTGHSKTSASTKPTPLGANGSSMNPPSTGGLAAGNAPSISSPTSNMALNLQETPASPSISVHSLNQPRKDGFLGPSLTLQSDKQKEKSKAIEATVDAPGLGSSALGMMDMHDPDANRIATSLHGGQGTIPSSPRSARSFVELSPTSALQPGLMQSARYGPKASPLRNSFVGPVSNLAVAPALSAAEEESETGSQVPPPTAPPDSNWTENQNDMNEQTDARRMPEGHRAGTTANLPSSDPITFSKLPPATPSSISSAQLSGGPDSPGRLSSYNIHPDAGRTDGEGAENTEGIFHYPRHSAPDPRNNPGAHSPPPDNASMLTLASSTGGRAPSVYTAASRYRDGIASGSIGGAPSIVDTAGHRYRTMANEDASIRAIAPSRRESSDSIGSKWSAAILSQRDGSIHTPSVHAQPAGTAAGDMVPDNTSYKRKTASMRTVATTASSYYAAPVASTTELKA